VVVIFANVAGNFSLTFGMRRTGPGVFESPLGYVTALFDPWVALGVCLLVLWMLSQMALLSWADLSYVLPVTSAGYVLAAIAGRLFLQERISTARWIGVALIMTGVVLVGRTAHSTTGEAGR
jgi:drug/metabolite transporter (DMT)-like permease